MSLISKINSLRSSIKSIQSLGESDEIASHFEKRANELVKISSELVNASNAFEFLSQHEIQVILDNENILLHKNKLIKIREEFILDPGSILESSDGKDLRHTFLAPFSSLPVTIFAVLSLAWSEWCNSRMPKISSEVLTVLENVGSIKTKIKELKTLKISINGYAASLPDSSNEIKNFLEKLKAFSDQWDSLGGNDIPPEAISFLRDAGQSSGANIDLMTDSISNWLSSHGLHKSLRIRIV
jgi:hypothetical protein